MFCTPGDGSINVWDDDFVIPVPEVDGALTATGSLVLGGHAKDDIIGTVLQLERHLGVTEKKEWDLSHKDMHI